MRAARSLTVSRSIGGLPAPGCRSPLQMQTPSPWMQIPPGHETSDACWEACDNITLPQTSFAGCKNIRQPISVSQLVMVILYDNS